MKKIVVGTVSLFAIALVGILTLNFALTPILNKFRPKIEAEIEKATKHPVSFDEISVQFLPYVGITLSNLQLANDNGENKISKVVLHASIIDILQGNVSVSELSLSDASATFLRDKHGNISIAGIALSKNTESTSGKTSPTSSKKSQHVDAGSALALVIKQAAISNATISFIDQSVEPAQTMELKDIDVELSDISNTGEGTIKVNANFLSNRQNITASGKVGILPAANGIPPLDLSFSIADFDIAKLKTLAFAYAKDLNALPFSSPLGINGRIHSENSLLKADISLTGNQPFAIKVALTSVTPLKGNVSLDTEKLLFTDIANAFPALATIKDSEISGIEVISDFSLHPTNAKVYLTTKTGILASAPLQAVALNATVRDSEIEINPSSIQGLGGQINLKGSISQSDPKPLTLIASAKNLDLTQLSQVALEDAAVSLRGTVTNLALDVTGNQTDLPNSLAGSVKLDAEKGALVGFNFFGEVIGAMEEIPGISESIEKSIPEEHRQFLAAKDTAYDTITARIALGNKEARIEQLDMIHSLYIVEIRGYTQFSGKLRIEGALKLTAPLTTKMIERNKRFKLLLDQSGNISIPIVLSRSSEGRVKVYPDTKELAKSAAGAVVEEKASKALDKISPGLGNAVKGLGGLFKR